MRVHYQSRKLLGFAFDRQLPEQVLATALDAPAVLFSMLEGALHF